MWRCPLVVLTIAMVATAAGAPQAQSPPLSAVMQEKALNAKGLLIPIVLADFAGISRYATRLGRLTLTEVATWQAQPNSEYERQANAFLQAIEDLGLAAEARDVTGASTAYGRLVSSCMNCHQLARPKPSRSLTAPAPVLDPSTPKPRSF